jgi:hypothetical protein
MADRTFANGSPNCKTRLTPKIRTIFRSASPINLEPIWKVRVHPDAANVRAAIPERPSFSHEKRKNGPWRTRTVGRRMQLRGEGAGIVGMPPKPVANRPKLGVDKQLRAKRARMENQPEWRNWQTRQVEGLVPVMGVQVQVLSPAINQGNGLWQMPTVALFFSKLTW